MLDHLVLSTPDLAATVADVARLTGVEPAPGGAHPGLGTRNYLLGLGGDSYLEIIGPDPDQPDPPGPRPFDVDTVTEARVVTWAVRTADVDASVTAAGKSGYDPGTPWTMARDTVDGRKLQWRLTVDRSEGHRGLIPFLIDWGDTPHPAAELPKVSLRELSAVHPDPTAIAPALSALGVDLAVRPGVRAGLVAVVDGVHGPVTIW
ncbi:VOC family protein [Stackebrandtia nassauensis]|uniref:Glyoxalase-like domain-containing protein n=1 Tax=Stackebrandtia nassauensis (strain DSM 44728 / CIP 108903 / NRRL B-16338 / NBRC 102104 / LLR-40K-21) TaxID=446470 RepID=D3Q0J0_STANL|nr:VOC family protein [Stackebrandtia nassauensis]ADD41726.1 conserved hypothetical protein [Stackebrandtia nassauensis DSM 44728]